jgi:hypothetical protein
VILEKLLTLQLLSQASCIFPAKVVVYKYIISLPEDGAFATAPLISVKVLKKLLEENLQSSWQPACREMAPEAVTMPNINKIVLQHDNG